MKTSQFDIGEAMKELSGKVSPFITEREFQLQLCLKILEMYPLNSSLAVECPYRFSIRYLCDGKNKYINAGKIDIVARVNDDYFPIELKYRTKKCNVVSALGDDIQLSSHGAYDDAGFGFVKDICRINDYVHYHPSSRDGYCIFLTNDCYYCADDIRNNSYSEFIINNLKPGYSKGKVNGKFVEIDIPKFDFISDRWTPFIFSQPCEPEFYYKIARIKQ